MKTIFTQFFNKTFKTLLAFAVVLLMSVHALAQVTATEDFENETTLNNTTPHTFTESGISFFSTTLFQNISTPRFGYSNSTSYIVIANELEGVGLSKSITINNASTSFKINSFAAFISSSKGGSVATNGNVTFVGTLVGGGTATATVNVPSTGTVTTPLTRETNNVVNGLSFTGTALDGVYVTSLAIQTSASVQFVELDHINFTTQAVVTNQFSINDVSQNEGNSGTTNFTFTVTRSNNTAASSVQVQSSNGTATSGSDYTAFPLTTLNFTAGGALTQTVNVVVNGDATVEPDETFIMTLSNPTGGVLLDATGTGTILDDDAINEPFDDETHQTSTFSQSGNNFQTTGKLIVRNAGNFGQGGTSGYAASTEPYAVGNQGSLQITSPGKSFNVISVDLWAASVTGTSPNFTYTPTNCTITFTGTKADGSGTVTHTAAITPSGTNVHSTVLFAGSPFAGVQLSAISFSTPTGIQYLQIDNFKYGTATLTNTQLSIDDVSVIEGTGAGSTTATFTVTRTNNTTAFSVDLASSNGTATAGTDYTAYTTTTLNFTSGGALTQTVNVTILKDASIEPDETFFMTLSNATNGTVFLKQVGTGIIQNDDSVVETFEDETNLATTFSQSGVSFSTSGGFTVRQELPNGSGSSGFFLRSSNTTSVGSKGTFTITTANKAFKLNFIDAWVGTSLTTGATGSITFTGTLLGGGTATATKTVTGSIPYGTGWTQNISFAGTALENVLLTAVQVSTTGSLTVCDIDNFNYTVVNTLPIIEVTDASNNAITNGGAAATANNTDFGGACVTGGIVSKTYTIKNSGLSNLTLSGSPLAVLGGADAGQFSITTQPTSPIAAAGSVTFTVQFDPSSAGVKNATITLTNNDATNSPYIINIKGTGNANPVATITPTPNPVCQNSTLNLSAPAGATTYLWSGNGIVLANANTTTAVPTTTGPQTYGLTATSSTGCTATATVSVTVNAQPSATITPTPNPVCQNSTLNLSAPAGATTYLWSGNGIVLANANTTTAVPTATGSQIYGLTATSSAGCTATSTVSVTVNIQPSAPTSPIATPSTIVISGNTTSLTATGCNSPSTISWYDLSNSTVALANNTPAITATKTFFARCTGTNGCVSSPSTNVTVTYNPCTPLSTSPGNVNITWTGLESTDWNTACNWNPAWVPDLTNNKVLIPNTTNKPVISSSIPDVKTLEVQSGALLTINSGQTLNIRGDGGVNKGLQIVGGTVTNNGTINIESSTNTAVAAYIYLQSGNAVLTNNGTIKINSTDEAIGVGLVSTPATITNSLNGVINIVNGIGVEIALPTDAVNFNNAGTINYDGSVLAFKFLGTTIFTNTGTVNINSGTGIENPAGNTIANNACGKIIMTTGTYTNPGTTTNSGLIQMPNTYSFTNTGTFTNNGVLKANAVSGITNNKVVITNACPIFTLGGSNNYTVNGIFTDAGATTSAGTYVSVGNKFTANNTIPAGSQTLYTKVTDGTCTFTVPFDFNNIKPTSVSISTTNTCVGTSITLSATCTSGTVTWYGSAAGTTQLGTGGTFSYVPSAGTGQSFYAACESTNCNSGRTITSNSVNVYTIPAAPTVTLTSPATVCQPATLNLTASGCAGTITWSDNSTGTSITISVPGTYNVSATCTTNGCTSVSSTGNNGLLIKAKPDAPTITPPTSLSVCSPSSLTLTATGCAGTVTWSQGGSTGTSLTLSAVGTYAVSATCTVNGCTSDASATINGLEIKAKPNAPTITPPTTLVVCSPSTLTLTASGCAGTVTWSQGGSTGANLTLSAAGTYSISATCTVNGCTSDVSTPVTGLEIKAILANPTGVSVNNTNICSGSSITLSASCTSLNTPNIFSQNPSKLTGSEYSKSINASNAAINTVLWYTQATGGTSIGSGSTFNYTPSNTATYYAACSDGTCESARVATGEVTVTTQPIIPTNVSVDKNTICSGESVSLTGNCSIGTITWYNQSTGGTSLGTGSSFSQSPTSNTTYYAACVNDICFSSRVATNQVTVITSPSLPTGTNNPTICNNTTATLTANCSTGNVVWYDSMTGGNIVSTTSPFVTPNLTAPTKYYPLCQNDLTNGSTLVNQTFLYTGAVQTFTVPAGVTSINITAKGAKGADASIGGTGGLGGTATGTLSVTPGQVLNIYVGGKNGFNGGGTGGFNGNTTFGGNSIGNAPNGGGASDVRVGGTALNNRVIVAGGGGGGGQNGTWPGCQVAGPAGNGGNGGGLTALNGTAGTGTPCNCGGGGGNFGAAGTQLAGGNAGNYTGNTACLRNTWTIGANGNLGLGGNGSTTFYNGTGGGGGGGGGYYGGGSGGSGSDTTPGGGGGGGSSYIGGVTNGNVTVGDNADDGQIVFSYNQTQIFTCSSNRVEVSVSINPVTTPTVNAPTQLVVCAPNTLTLTATCISGNVLWSDNSTGTSLTISAVGTYSISAVCVFNGCTSAASNIVTGLEIKSKPNAPTITPPTSLSVCSPSSLTLTASGCAGTVTWSQGGSTGTSLTLSAVGTYAVSATCTVNGCTSDASATVNGLEIKAKPNAPTITPPTTLVVCSPSTLTLTASGCAGMVTWSQGGSTGTSLTLSAVGTYSISATCTVNGCTSDPSTSVNGLEIKAKPNAPTVTPPTSLSVCSPSSLTLSASGCAGTVTWSQGGSTGTSLTLSAVGTYSISATCTANGCTSDASTTVNGLEIKAKPNAPAITPPTTLVVCSPSTLTLTASGCAGTVTWSQGGSTGTSLTLSATGTYAISATCTVNGCTSDASTSVNGLEIKAKPNAPTVTPPTSLSVCSPSSLTLSASGCAGTVTWSQGGSTGTSLTLSAVGTYAVSATCTVNGCTSDASATVNGLEIKAKPNALTITPPTTLVVCSPSTLTLTASGCAGMVTWSPSAATGTSLTLSAVGTYSISATCTVNGCTSDASTTVTGLEIKATPIITATNTGPYTVGQTINLNGTGGGSYSWNGPNNFSSTLSNPTISNTLSVNGGVYTLSVVGTNGCSAIATTNVVINGVDPCDPSRIVDYLYVKAGNPYQPLFPLTNGMIINQMTDQVSILVNPVCPSVTIESFEMNLQGPEMNWNILQNVSPYALFDNFGLDVWGRNFKPGNYTLTVTGYAQDNKGGGVTYGPKIITFTVVGNLATINAPTLSKTAICAGNSVDVTFSTTGTFNGSNQFSVELSDSSGSFAAPILIGTTNTTGTLTCTIPQNTLEGTKYLIRVTSSNQVVVSNPAISQVTVHPLAYNLVSPNNNLTGTNTKKAVNTINASNKVSSPANITYQAGKSIVLSPGFESGAVFKAEIQGCSN
ncbi:hypothetical protein GCM10011514_54780 [Emticicia aquatilis]|uniref:Choice-of-anchor D domain-containing protein n=1 Tax=Emticicia aquatilis TaxID=1537369 RepID=A0A916ZAI0_9BACT|nr:Calx-beta domain-containing protein [Emticicia aquatilis]GGD83830.1 hypothetical protein GCM10011514_54780 [Emticicia aquatilis]